MTIIKTFETEENNSIIAKKYIVIVSAALFALTLVQIWTSNTVITYGERYDQLQSLERSLKIENQILQNEVAKNSSLTAIASKSAELGFSNSQSIQYIR